MRYHATHRDADAAGHAEHGRSQALDAVDVGADVDRHAGDRGHPGLLAGFFSKDEILASVFGRGAGQRVFYLLLAARLARVAADGDLHGAASWR